jgi:hypothetical protein
MSQYRDGILFPVVAVGAIAQYARVKPTGTVVNGALQVTAAGVGATDWGNEIGTLTEPALVAGQVVTCRGRKALSAKFVASDAIAAGTAFYGAASGQIATTASGTQLGILGPDAATASGDIVEGFYL